MKLNDLLLKKEELPITDEICFMIPIHPKLLDENISINPDIAKDIFPKVAEEWYEDLTKYFETEKENFEYWKREQIKNVYLKEKPKITKEFNRQFVNETWEDKIQNLENGLTIDFSISRNGGGSLYFDKDDNNCKSFGVLYNNLLEEKKKEFVFENNPDKIYIYAQHNIDSYPGALFLRNWAIKYMNEIFKEIF